jgi:hypothetical protein
MIPILATAFHLLGFDPDTLMHGPPPAHRQRRPRAPRSARLIDHFVGRHSCLLEMAGKKSAHEF